MCERKSRPPFPRGDRDADRDCDLDIFCLESSPYSSSCFIVSRSFNGDSGGKNSDRNCPDHSRLALIFILYNIHIVSSPQKQEISSNTVGFPGTRRGFHATYCTDYSSLGNVHRLAAIQPACNIVQLASLKFRPEFVSQRR